MINLYLYFACMHGISWNIRSWILPENHGNVLVEMCMNPANLRKNNYLHLWSNPPRSEAQTGNPQSPAQMPRERHTLRPMYACSDTAILVSDSLGARLLSERPNQSPYPCPTWSRRNVTRVQHAGLLLRSGAEMLIQMEINLSLWVWSYRLKKGAKSVHCRAGHRPRDQRQQHSMKHWSQWKSRLPPRPVTSAWQDISSKTYRAPYLDSI